MTDRELLEKILQKIGNMDSRITDIETNMATKDKLADIKAEIVNIKADVKSVSYTHLETA